jgi:opacity protein-like surface antigen
MIATAFKRTVVETSRPLLQARTFAGRRRRFRAPAAAAIGLLLCHAGAAGVARAAAGGPRTNEQYVQYGVGFTTETVASPGGICPAHAGAPCILGSGIGLGLRAGYRSRSSWYIGGAYEFSRQDSSNLIRLAILQQLRAEARYYLREGGRLVPYLGFGVGGALYGNEWGSTTWGLTAFLGAGVEFEVSRTSVVGAAVGYRPLAFHSFRDSAGQSRAEDLFGFGVAHIVGIELVFEVRNPLPRW